MTLPGKHTAADYIPWDTLTNFIAKLERDGLYKMSLLCALASFFGLRIGDVLNLKWSEILEKESITVQEQKTKNKKKKPREISIVLDIQKMIQRIYLKIGKEKPDSYVFLSERRKSHISVQYVNTRLKELGEKYKLNVEKLSTHSLRKSFGRKILDDHDYSDYAYTMLGDIFGHRDKRDTKKYLGITRKEIQNIYNSLKL